MPRTLCWRRLVLAATVGAAAVVGLTPAHARADELIASFVRNGLECPPTGKMPLGARPSFVNQGPEMTPAVSFAPSDQGMPGHRKRAQAAHTSRQALRQPLTLSSLILMIFNVPAMPSQETTSTGSVLSGSGTTSMTQGTTEIVSSSSSSSPPTASEPTALVSSFLGFGLTGMFTVFRRRTRRRRRRRGG